MWCCGTAAGCILRLSCRRPLLSLCSHSHPSLSHPLSPFPVLISSPTLLPPTLPTPLCPLPAGVHPHRHHEQGRVCGGGAQAADGGTQAVPAGALPIPHSHSPRINCCAARWLLCVADLVPAPALLSPFPSPCLALSLLSRACCCRWRAPWRAACARPSGSCCGRWRRRRSASQPQVRVQPPRTAAASTPSSPSRDGAVQRPQRRLQAPAT